MQACTLDDARRYCFDLAMALPKPCRAIISKMAGRPVSRVLRRRGPDAIWLTLIILVELARDASWEAYCWNASILYVSLDSIKSDLLRALERSYDPSTSDAIEDGCRRYREIHEWGVAVPKPREIKGKGKRKGEDGVVSAQHFLLCG